MSAFLIGHIRVKDPLKWEVYVRGVAESLRPVEADIVFRGRKSDVLAGTHPYDLAVVIRFRDREEMNRWFHSEAYQKLIPVRDQAADVIIISYDA